MASYETATSQMPGYSLIRKVLPPLVALLALCARPAAAVAQGPVVTPGQSVVLVEWVTESEVNVAGFNVYRSENPQGPYVKLNDSLIPASPEAIAGGSYAYTDTTATAGLTYYYKLEEVELDGNTTMHGPTQVMAEAEVVPRGFDGSKILAIALLAALLSTATFFMARRRKASKTRSASASAHPDDSGPQR